jgi:hypothetical protein
MAIIKDLGDGNQAISMDGNEQVLAADLVMFPGSSESITLVCAGPNPVNYYTEGNPPGLGINDNGIIEVNSSSTFTITGGEGYEPRVFFNADLGQTIVGAFGGLVAINGNSQDVPNAIDYIRCLFSS